MIGKQTKVGPAMLLADAPYCAVLPYLGPTAGGQRVPTSVLIFSKLFFFFFDN